MDHEELFVRTLRDLEDSLKPLDEYKFLRVAAKLRQLLLDGGNLIDLVNRVHKRKVVFRANCGEVARDELSKRLASSGQLNWIRLDAVAGAVSIDGRGLTELSRDRFLKCVVLRYGNYEYTVHELIRYVAHVEGGVHQGRPPDPKERALFELGEGNFTSSHFQPGVFALLSIARIVLRALAGLRAEIEASRPDIKTLM